MGGTPKSCKLLVFFKDWKKDIQVSPMLFLFAIGFSWCFWGIVGMAQIDAKSLPGIILIALGGLGPAVSAIAILYVKESWSTRKNFWKRVFLFRPCSVKVWFFVFALPLVLQVLSIYFSFIIGSPVTQVYLREEFYSPWNLVTFALFVLFFGPLTEEIGWRGYGLPALLRKVPPISASLLVACFWAFWHLPLFFIPEYPLAVLVKEPPRFLFYLLDFFPNSILYTWLFLSTGGSTAAAILFHWSGNFWGMAFDTTITAEGISLLFKTLCAICLTVHGGGEVSKDRIY